jgi:hypothetical protein
MSETTVKIILEHSVSDHYDELAENDLVNSLPWKLPHDAKLYVLKPALLNHVETSEPVGGAGIATELLITLAQHGGTIAAVAAALYSAIKLYFHRNKYREVTLERGDVKWTIRGHSMPEEKELLHTLFPEAPATNVDPSPSKIELSFTTARLRLTDSGEE